MKFKEIPLEKKNEWISETNGRNLSYYHSWDYCDAISQSSKNPIFLLSIEYGKSKLLCVLSKREKLHGYTEIYTPYGYGGIVIFAEKFFEEDFRFAWVNYCKKCSYVCSYILLHPTLRLNNDWGGDLFNHHKTYKINLDNDIDYLWSKLKKGHKYEIKKCKKNINFSIINDSNDLTEPVKKLYYDTIKRVGASEVYSFSERTIEKIINSKSVLTLGAKIDHKIEAVVVMPYTNYISEYFLSASSFKGKSYTRNLIWEAIKIFKEKKISTFNLGGGIKTNDQLCDFKRRFGGEEYSLQVLKEVHDINRYKDICNKLGFDAKSKDGFFPPYWK